MMLSSGLEDVPWVDAFDLPSIFDPRLPLYKEWHDFVFFDRSSGLFALLNFAVHGNPYDTKRGYGAALAFLSAPGGKIHTAMKLIPLRKLTVSRYNPEFLAEGEVSVSYNHNAFAINGKIDDVSLDLSAPVALPPVTMTQIGFDVLSRDRINLEMLETAGSMAATWDKWVELPRLSVKGRVGANGKTYSVDTDTGYQDHEGGRFDWGTVAGWDTGVLLCDPEEGEPEKVSFLFYRYGPTGTDSYGGVIVKTADGKQRFFGEEKTKISRSGEFKGPRGYLPGVTKLLYPDYEPKVPAKIEFEAKDSPDSLEVTFTPRAVCTIVVPGVDDAAETTFNEMHCDASFKASIGGETFDQSIPCWFESVRPRHGGLDEE